MPDEADLENNFDENKEKKCGLIKNNKLNLFIHDDDSQVS